MGLKGSPFGVGITPSYACFYTELHEFKVSNWNIQASSSTLHPRCFPTQEKTIGGLK